MTTKQHIKNAITHCSLFSLLALFSCSNNDISQTGINHTATSSGAYFLGVQADGGTEYIMQTSSISEGNLDIKNNIGELPNSSYTWVSKGNVAIGMSYQQASAGEGYAIKLKSGNEPLTLIGRFLVSDRYTTFGFINNNHFVTSVAGQVGNISNGGKQEARTDLATFDFWTIENDGLKLKYKKTITTKNITQNGQQATFSGIVDNGDGTFFTAMVESDINENYGNANGSSVGRVKFPDSCWVVQFDTTLAVKHIFKDNRISYASGQFRSQTLNSIFRADDGAIYVFSNSYDTNSTKPAGAIRINKNENMFDPNYYFNIEEKTQGYKFRRVWFVGGTKFLLELYNNKVPSSTGAATHYAIIDVGTKDYKEVVGLPQQIMIISGTNTGDVPLAHNNKVFIPITQRQNYASLYEVDLETAIARKALTIKGATQIRGVCFLNSNNN